MRRQNLGTAQPWHLLHTDPSLTPQTSCSPLVLIGVLSQKQPTHPFPSPLLFLMGPSWPHRPYMCRCQVH
uniref:Uncharacterized protein n=1 Tax=Piliocolobus tephrosceles TaxID=591936 RepID=A0A8C9HPE0_9PRIM